MHRRLFLQRSAALSLTVVARRPSRVSMPFAQDATPTSGLVGLGSA